MKFDKVNKELQQECLDILKNKEDKSSAILEVVEKLNTASHQQLIDQITYEAERSKSDASFKKELGLRILSKEEKYFYEQLKEDPKQSFTAEQTDIIPTTIIDRTLDSVKKKSRIAELINFTPSTVKKWIVAEKQGTYHWGELTSKLAEEISVTFSSINNELGKVYVMLVIPKAIRELAYEFVDRYVLAVLEETLNDGVEYAYCDGTGKDMPIGIMRMVETKNEDGTAQEKTVHADIKGFSPKHLAPVKKLLSNEGKRSVSTLYLVCNPEDCYEYVEPALYGQNIDGSYSQKSQTKIEVIDCPNCPKGKAAFTLKDMYSMGFSGIKIHEYKETLAKEDANLLIGKAYGNGRPVDDKTAYVFDVTKLEEYVLKVGTITEQSVALEKGVKSGTGK